MARKAAPPPSAKRGKGKKGLGEWYQDPTDKNWYADSMDPSEEHGARVRMMNGKWRGAGNSYLAYRGGLYLGFEPTLEEAQALAESGKRKESATIIEHARMVSVPPSEPETKQVQDARMLRTQMRGDRKVGKAKVEVALDRDKKIKMLTTINHRRPGSGAHERFAKLMSFNGKSIGAYLDAGGNPETLVNAVSANRASME